MDKKILAENVKLRARVSKYQQELHRERQKNKDITKSRDAYKSKNKDTVWHISSDIIESLFGYYKFRKSTNPLNGVTTQIFILPPVTKINKKTGRVSFSVKTALENVFLTNLKQWRDNHLTENMAVAGRKILLSAQVN